MADYSYYSKLSRSADLVDKKDRWLYRFFEILPGLLAWVTLALIVILSFTAPVFIAVFIILFDTYWLIKTIYLSLHLRVAFNKMRRNLEVDWIEKLNQLPATLAGQAHDPGRAGSRQTIDSWQDVYHLVILPMYKEGLKVVMATLDGLLATHYPKTKMIVVLAQEERAGQLGFNDLLEKQYRNKFFKFVITRHPAGLAGEIPGKGSNAAFAARCVKEEVIDPLTISYDRIIVSNLDVDTVVSPHYFSLLTYLFLTTPDPLRTSYQPIPLYTNNIWEAPALARVVAFSATFWHTIQQERQERLTTFSSHSMPFQALVDVDFWQVNMVSEDSRVFWQCFLRYNGDYRVTPMFYPVAMDANVAPGFWQTMTNVYKQQRRWGYGVENIPYFFFGFLKNKLIPIKKKIYYVFTILESFHSWATNAIIIFLLGWLPVIVGGSEFNRTVLSLNLPRFTRTIMELSLAGLISSAVLSMILLPPRPLNFGKHKYIIMLLQWILFPVTTIVLGAIPGIEAQIRLMLGRYLGFWVTPKTRIMKHES